jgi:hypothetical protein
MYLQVPKPSRDPYPSAAKLWMWTGVVFFSWPILAVIARSHGTGGLREVGTVWAAFMAIAAVIGVAWKRDDRGEVAVDGYS